MVLNWGVEPPEKRLQVYPGTLTSRRQSGEARQPMTVSAGRFHSSCSSYIHRKGAFVIISQSGHTPVSPY